MAEVEITAEMVTAGLHELDRRGLIDRSAVIEAIYRAMRALELPPERDDLASDRELELRHRPRDADMQFLLDELKRIRLAKSRELQEAWDRRRIALGQT